MEGQARHPPHWGSTSPDTTLRQWVDLGEHAGFNVPFSYDITRAIRFGDGNVIVLRVENPPFDVQASPDNQIPMLPVGMVDYIADWAAFMAT